MTSGLLTPWSKGEMRQMGAVWVRLTDFPNYAVSGDGRVMRLAGNQHGATEGRILKANPNVDGYPTVSLRVDGKTKCVYVHRLVAENFIPNPQNKPEVNHCAEKHNNNFDKLEWATSLENNRHAFAVGLNPKGENRKHSKLTRAIVDNILSLLTKGTPQHRLAKEFGVCQQTISDIQRGRIWKK